MKEALRIRTIVRAGGKIEIADPQFVPGDAVEVIVLAEPSATSRRSAVDILAEAPGHRLFRTADEVDAYLRHERDSWD